MTRFALALWIFERTGQATSLALVGLSAAIPRMLVILLAGSLIDRFNRKTVMIVTDSISGTLTVALFGLWASGGLELWHIYAVSAISGTFEQMQSLAFSAVSTQMVNQRHYGRIGAMTTMMWYSGDIVAGPVATLLYVTFGLGGVMLVDLATFAYAMVATGLSPVPLLQREVQPPQSVWKKIKTDLTLGMRFIGSHRSLRTLLLINLVFMFGHDMIEALNAPMILSRTNNDSSVLAAWLAAAGAGGILSSLIMSAWGGPKRRTIAYLISSISAGFGKLLVGLGRNVGQWVPAQAYTSTNFPVRASMYQAIWRAKTPAEMQGRVFATLFIAVDLVGFSGMALASTLADFVFEPAMRDGGSLVGTFGWLVGTGPGAGMSLLFAFAACLMMAAPLCGLFMKHVRQTDRIVPDVSHKPADPVTTPAASNVEDVGAQVA